MANHPNKQIHEAIKYAEMKGWRLQKARGHAHIEFTLFIPEIDDATVDAIYGRCADASIGKSHGVMYIAFDREAVSLEAAIQSATEDLRQLGVVTPTLKMTSRDSKSCGKRPVVRHIGRFAS